MFEPLMEDLDTQIHVVDGFIAVAKAKKQLLVKMDLEEVRLQLVKSKHSLAEASRYAEDAHKHAQVTRPKVLTKTS